MSVEVGVERVILPPQLKAVIKEAKEPLEVHYLTLPQSHFLKGFSRIVLKINSGKQLGSFWNIVTVLATKVTELLP